MKNNNSKISRGWEALSRRRRLSISSSKEECGVWYTHISLANISLIILLFIVLIFAAAVAIISYTSFIEMLPGHRSKTLENRRYIIESIVKIDSMERVIDNMMLYSENVALIMGGRLPEVEQMVAESAPTTQKETVAPNAADSALRRQISRNERYNPLAATTNLTEQLLMPVEGVVTRHFDISKQCFGVEITPSEEVRVVAVQRGVVLLALWSPESGYLVEILHPNGMVSIYKNIRNIAVERGTTIKAGEVVGYSYDERGAAETTIGFELWSGTKPLDPEEYVIFKRDR